MRGRQDRLRQLLRQRLIDRFDGDARQTALDVRLFLRIKCAIILMGRPRSFRNPRRVSLTLNRETLVTARRLARQARRSLSEVISEILDSHFRKVVAPGRGG